MTPIQAAADALLRIAGTGEWERNAAAAMLLRHCYQRPHPPVTYADWPPYSPPAFIRIVLNDRLMPIAIIAVSRHGLSKRPRCASANPFFVCCLQAACLKA